MLSEKLLSQTEQIFHILESGHLSNQLCQFVLQKMRITDHEQYAYIDWLLTRWSSIRLNKYDLPKKQLISQMKLLIMINIVLVAVLFQ